MGLCIRQPTGLEPTARYHILPQHTRASQHLVCAQLICLAVKCEKGQVEPFLDFGLVRLSDLISRIVEKTQDFLIDELHFHEKFWWHRIAGWAPKLHYIVETGTSYLDLVG